MHDLCPCASVAGHSSGTIRSMSARAVAPTPGDVTAMGMHGYVDISEEVIGLGPGQETTGGYKNINPLWLKGQMRAFRLAPSMEKALEIGRGIRTELWDWISSYKQRENSPGLGFVLFKTHWSFVRLLLDLQTRLLAEQILWEMGKPWSTLCTGFKPLPGYGRTSGAVVLGPATQLSDTKDAGSSGGGGTKHFI